MWLQQLLNFIDVLTYVNQVYSNHIGSPTRDEAVEDAALGAGSRVVDVVEAALGVDEVPDAPRMLTLSAQRPHQVTT